VATTKTPTGRKREPDISISHSFLNHQLTILKTIPKFTNLALVKVDIAKVNYLLYKPPTKSQGRLQRILPSTPEDIDESFEDDITKRDDQRR
jgi:hypothetical protein